MNINEDIGFQKTPPTFRALFPSIALINGY